MPMWVVRWMDVDAGCKMPAGSLTRPREKNILTIYDKWECIFRGGVCGERPKFNRSK